MWLQAWVILDAERNALQRAALAGGQPRIGGGRHGSRLVVRDDHIGVERRVGGVDRFEIGLGQLGGGDVASAQPGARLGNGQSGQFAHGHWPMLF
jgi:hypothetical protein